MAGKRKERSRSIVTAAAGDAELELPEDLEAFRWLTSMAHNRFGAVPGEAVARHVLRVTRDGDWPLQEAAMKALIRRAGFGDRDELRVARRPPGRTQLGVYATRVPRRKGERPYRTLLARLAPISGSCDCRDFARSSLGLCKHLLVVLDDVCASERRAAQARRERAIEPSPMRWDPVRPLHGHGDWLDGVRWCADSGKQRRATEDARAAFTTRTGRLQNTHRADAGKRLALVERLLGALPRGKSKEQDDPALRALLEREQRVLSFRVETQRLARQPRSYKQGLRRTLYAYQQEGVRRFLATGRLLLGDDMGLGKTTQAIAACHALFHAGKVRRGLVIVPASLKWQWLREWEGVTDVPAAIVEGPPRDRRAQYEGLRRGFLILNYELLLRDAAALHAIGADMVVLDEAQRIKNWATKTAAHVKSLRVPYRLVLTGTPMENRLEELASIYDWVDDVALEPKWRLVPHHAILVQDGERGEVVGAKNLDTLRERISDTFLRRVRKEVLAQLPPRTDTRIPVPLTPEQVVAHSDLDQPIAQLATIAKRRPLRQPEFLRLMSLLTTQRIICNGMAQKEFESVWPMLPDAGPASPLQLQGLFSPKLAALRELIDDLVGEQGRKVVIFSQWKRMLRLAAWALADVLRAHGRRAVFFTGAESQRQRTRGVVELHDDPDTAVMFLSDAGGVGLNLQRAASACINLELPWNPAVLEQRIGRIYRLGQPDKVDVFNLVSEAGIEARIAGLVSAKQALFTGLFDGVSDEILFDGAGTAMAQIQRLVELPPNDDFTMDAHEDEATNDDDADDLPDVADAPAPCGPDLDTLTSPTMPLATDVQALLAQLSVRSTPTGGIAIEAPPEAAKTLAALFGTMAKLLESQAHE